MTMVVLICFWVYSRIIRILITIATMVMMISGIGRDRAAPVLKTGTKIVLSSHWSTKRYLVI